MLENWCWEVRARAASFMRSRLCVGVRPPLALLPDPAQASTVQRMSRHVETGAPLPAELAGALARSKLAHAGLLNKRQIT